MPIKEDRFRAGYLRWIVCEWNIDSPRAERRIVKFEIANNLELSRFYIRQEFSYFDVPLGSVG